MAGRQGTREAPIRVKLMSRMPEAELLRYFPGGMPYWGECEFVFDLDARDYDWLVVYDDLPPRAGERRSSRVEALACPRRHTLLVTTEPSSIKVYGRSYCAQFGHVLTSQEEWALPHPRRIHGQPALHWFYGAAPGAYRSIDAMRAHPPLAKSADLSTVCSSKRQGHTLHDRRFTFTWWFKGVMPELEIFGRGVRPMADKADALDTFRYHLAIENYRGAHHWTEKLADAFLGCTLPFYAGCPNAADYFPDESFIPIDLDRPEEAARVIRSAIASGEYEKRLPAIMEARRRVLEEYSLIATVSRIVGERHTEAAAAEPGARLYSRRALRRARPWVLAEQLYGRILQTLRR